MKRLLKDAQKISGVKYDIKNLSDVYEAIHVIQTELGITGTTAEEAKTTISGSLNMMKAAWRNLQIAIADPQGNIRGAINNLVSSAKIAAKNVMPAVRQALTGIGTAVAELAPVFAKELPSLFNDLIPSLADAAGSLIDGLITGISTNLPALISGFRQVFKATFDALSRNAPRIMKSLGDAFTSITSNFKWPTWDDVKAGANQAWDLIKAGVRSLGGLVFGRKGDGSVNWPTWDDVGNSANAAWTAIKANAKKLAGLVFGLKGNGEVNWPTWDDVAHSANAAWTTIKAEAKKLAGLVFGTSANGQVNWPTWRTVRQGATNAWNEIKAGVAKFSGLVFGDTTAITSVSSLLDNIDSKWKTVKETIESNVINIATAFFGDENAETIAGAIGVLGDAIPALLAGFATFTAVQKITQVAEALKTMFTLGLTANKTALAFGAIATAITLIYENWDLIVEKFNEVKEWATKNIFEPFGQWFDQNITGPLQDMITWIDEAIANLRKTLGLDTGAPLNLDSGTLQEMKKAWIQEFGKTGPNENDPEIQKAAENFNKSLAKIFEKAGIDPETGLEIFNFDSMKEAFETLGQEDFFASFESGGPIVEGVKEEITATTGEAEGLKSTLDSIEGDYAADIYIRTHGGIPSIPLEPVTRNRRKPSRYEAKGDWNVPYDDYVARLHRGEMVLTKSQARQFREGGFSDSRATVAAIQKMANRIENLQLVVGEKVFGQTVVNYGGDRLDGYIGESESRLLTGYGW